MNHPVVNVIGAGLAGCEAAWQLAKRGIHSKLFEMRPQVSTPVHKTQSPARASLFQFISIR